MVVTDILKSHKRLKENPIYALSLGSRELFHSNFLKWMFDKYPLMVGVLIEGCKPEDGFEPKNTVVAREEKNLDLIVRFKAGDALQAIVIEVKVKDAPRLDQLKKYDDKIEEHFKSDSARKVHKVLLSLVAPPKNSTWGYLSFSTLGASIRAFLSGSDVSNDDRVIIKGYADLCCDLGELVLEVIKFDQVTRDYFYPKPGEDETATRVDDDLKEVRFLDTINKHRASKLSDKIESEFEFKCIKSNFASNDIKPKFACGFDRKMPHVGATLVLKSQKDPDFEISLGIHIQGTQYRRLLSFNRYVVNSKSHGKDPDGLKYFIEKTDAWKWMFGSTHVNGYFDNPNGQDGFFKDMEQVPTSQQKSKQLCSYAPKYIYQYTTIGYDNVGVRTCDLVDALISDLRYASTLLSDREYVGRFEKWLQTSR